ncbi:MAG: PorV/PorQ family protein [Bacteroidota bacterium]|nr:PorV/PorQ family protein [Bacteroidota bacterium]
MAILKIKNRKASFPRRRESNYPKSVSRGCPIKTLGHAEHTFFVKFILCERENVVWLLFAICITVSIIFSPKALAQKVGSTSMQFLHVMPVARATALGDAYSVWASGAEAVFWNPGGVALVRSQELSSTYIDWLFDTQQGALSYAVSLGNIGAAGAQIQYVDFGEFEETSVAPPYIKDPSAPGLTGRTFHPFSYLFGVTYARSLTDRFSTGLSVKYAYESLFNGEMVRAMVSQGVYENVKTWGSGVLFDFGVRYNTGYKTIQLGASVQNFGANIQYAKESSPAPLLFRFGTAADIVGTDGLLVSSDGENRVSVAFDLFQPNDYDQQQHLGIEYEFAGTFALRAGYKFNYDSEGLTLGAGFKQTLSSVKLSLDYSYGSMGVYLGNAQRISLGAEIQ